MEMLCKKHHPSPNCECRDCYDFLETYTKCKRGASFNDRLSYTLTFVACFVVGATVTTLMQPPKPAPIIRECVK